jgi:hypothetical protein
MKNTVSGQIETFASAKQKIQPKMALNERELILFDHITSSKEVSAWDDNSLFIASNLAMIYRRIEEINTMLETQGVVQRNERGTQIANPLFSAMTQLLSQAQSANKTLGLSASQRGLTGAPQKSRDQADAHARAIIGKASEDSLLA